MSSRDLPSFLLMQNPIQGYDWGSHDALTTLFGIPNPAGKPQAELWMGAHPNGCSEVTLAGDVQKLSTLIESAPAAVLGDATVARFGSLPFLFKVLCAEKALSIQVHPSKAQAEAGFAKEEAAGIPIKAGNRNYKDPNHKPELVFALTPYQAMNGFRAIPAILALFERVNLTAIADLTAAFAASQNESGLQHFFHQLLILTGARKEAALAALQAVGLAVAGIHAWLLLRGREDGQISRSIISGRVMYGETLRDALFRHLEKDLGPMAFPQLPASPKLALQHVDKVLSEWNAMMLSSLCEAAAAFGREDIVTAVVRNAEFLRDNLQTSTGQWHRSWQSHARPQAQHAALAHDLAHVHVADRASPLYDRSRAIAAGKGEGDGLRAAGHASLGWSIWIDR